MISVVSTSYVTVTYSHSHGRNLCVITAARWSEYNTNVLEYEYDYFEHA